MAPLIVLLSSWLILGLVGRFGVQALDSPAKAGRAALAIMFVFTGSTHFSSMRGQAPMSLWLRTPIQLVFILSLWWSAVRAEALDTTHSV